MNNLHEHGRKLISEVENEKAVKILEEALTEDPKNSDIYVDLGLAYLNLGEYENAHKNWGKAEALAPNNYDLLWNIGYLYELEKDYVNAKTYYLRALTEAQNANKSKKAEKFEEWVKKVQNQI